MSISEPFIRRPIGTSLLAAAILLAGFTAYRALPVAPLPRVDFPTIQVSGALPGASPETMASSIATPLERRFGRIAGISEITSTSSLGSCSLVLQFDLDRDVDAAARDVQAAINAAGGDLPANLPTRPTYRKVNPADAPILVIALTSDTVPLAKIFDVANNILTQRLSQVDGVGQVFVGGGQQPAVRVQADPAALAGMGLTLADVRTMLASTNVMEAKGSLQGPNQSYTMNINDQLYKASDYAKSVLAYVNDAPVRLADVARVFDDVENSRVAAWHNGKRAVLLIIRRQPEANIIDTIDRVKAELPALSTAVPPGVAIDMAMDRSTTIRASVEDVETTLVITVLLVVLVVFAFLRSPRATAIPSVAVPLSIVGTFAGMYALDYSIDNLSLMALTISTGFVVDDAIVVTENISRLLEEGKSRIDAALIGAKQVGFTIVSITASLLAVFIPILLMGGIVGRLFREFAMTLSLAIFVSAIVSLTLTPMMCALLLKREAGAQHGRLYRLAEGLLDGMTRGYERGLRWAFAHKRTMLVLTLACVILNVGLFILVPKGLFPQQDTGLITGFSESSQDMSFLAMKKREEAIDAVVRADPDIEHMVSFIGATNGNTGNTGNTGTIFMQLRSKPERKATAEEVIARLRPKLAQVPGITLYLQAAQDIRVGGRSSRTQYQYTVQDANLIELRTWAPRLLKRFSALPQLKDVATDQQTSGLQVNLWIDRDTASRMGISPLDIDNALYDAFGQRQVSTIFTEINEYRVVLEMKPELQDGPEALQRLYVHARTGDPVPMSAFTRFDVTGTPLAVNHQGQFPSVTLSFNLAPNVSLGDAVAAINAAQDEIGLPASVHASFAGTAQAFRASLSSEPWLVLAALITVYIVLGVLYESFIHPITILSTLPSAGVGALLALLGCGTEFSIIALIGIILLIGIVKKNAIMMIDFAIESERELGMTSEQAAFHACLLRFRPIMMTTLAAMLGGLPLALGQGTGAELRRPLGIAIVGGLVISQALTLFTTPIVYIALDRFSRRRRERHLARQTMNPV